MPHPAVRQPTSPSHGSTAVTLHFRERQNKQPLYRPAALRRNGSVQRDLFMHPSPPHSPSLAATESKSASWLSTLAAPFSPVSQDSSRDIGAAFVRGRMLPRSQWKPDDEADNCADPDCSLKFDLINRRHHCRTCGDIFCAAHSSRSTLLWPSSEDDSVPAFTPRGTPRATPRSSAIDLPSLAYSVSPSNASAISTASTASTSSTPTSSSPPSQTNLMPLSARVCDRCYFSAPNPSGAPTPLLTPPVLAHPLAPYSAFGNAAYAGAGPLTLRHPHSRASSASRASSPAHSPPNTHHAHAHGKASSRSRSRQGSPTSTSSVTTTSEYSTPSTSVEGLAAYGTSASTDGTSPESLVIPPKLHGRRKQPSLSRNSSASRLAAAAGSRGASPASVRGARCTAVTTPKVVREDELLSDSSDSESEGSEARRAFDGLSNASTEVEDGPPRLAAEEEDSDEDDERHERTVKERRRLQQEFGSVQGGPWQSWATF
ncbi:FYVE zinc finger-domain containing protein [Rhodotorula toruloides]|nr:FYVE zinc finger-domain containing protein [Rhodotorula toruloides]